MRLQSHITDFLPTKSANDLGHAEKLILCFASSKFHGAKNWWWIPSVERSKLN